MDDELSSSARRGPVHARLARTRDVRAARERDVRSAVRRAAADGLTVRVLSSGLGTPSDPAGTLVLDVSGLRDVEVDPRSRVARAGGGATWSDVRRAAAPHGLVPVEPTTGALGVAGYLLGGGLGRLVRAQGVGAQRLLAARVVTGSGEVVAAHPDDDAELLWALRGGRYGLGVVVETRIGLVDARPAPGGTLTYALVPRSPVLARWLDWTRTAPRSITTGVTLHGGSPGAARLVVHVACADDTHGTRRALARLRSVGTPVAQDVRCGPPDGPAEGLRPWGTRTPRHRSTLDHGDAVLADALLAVALDPRTGAVELRHLGGAMHDVPPGAAVGHVDVDLALVVAARDGLAGPRAVEHLTAVQRLLAPWTSAHLTPHWINDPRSADEHRRTWPPATARRLAAVRAVHDPTGLLWPDRPREEVVLAAPAPTV